MLFLNPRTVRFAGGTWGNVVSVAVERAGTRVFEERGEGGAYPVLADVAEQRVTVTVVQELHGDDLSAPRPGEAGTLVFTTAASGGSPGAKDVSISCVVTDLTYTLSQKTGASRKVVLTAVSTDGAADPVVVTAA